MAVGRRGCTDCRHKDGLIDTDAEVSHDDGKVRGKPAPKSSGLVGETLAVEGRAATESCFPVSIRPLLLSRRGWAFSLEPSSPRLLRITLPSPVGSLEWPCDHAGVLLEADLAC